MSTLTDTARMSGASRQLGGAAQVLGAKLSWAWWCRGRVLWPLTFLATLALAWEWQVGPQVGAWLRARDHESSLRAEHLAASARAQQLAELAARKTELQAQLDLLFAPMSPEWGMASLLHDLASAGQARGLRVDGIKPLPARPQQTHEELSVALKVSGSYRALRAFLGDVAQLPGMVTLHDWSVSPMVPSLPQKAARHRGSLGPGHEGDGPVLLLEATVRAYRGLDEPMESAYRVRPDAPPRVPTQRASILRPMAATENPFDMNRLWREAAPQWPAPDARSMGGGTPWLEQQPLDSMVLVGVLGAVGRPEHRLALVRAGGIVQMVRAGQGMGLSGGRVTQISDQALTVSEPVDVARGRGKPRITVLPLQETKP